MNRAGQWETTEGREFEEGQVKQGLGDGGRRTETRVSSWAAGAKRKGRTVEPQDAAGVERDGHFVVDRQGERARRREER